jgi:hypothetical protein
MSSHEKYLELCAASTAGELSPDEQKILEDHLAGMCVVPPGDTRIRNHRAKRRACAR